MELIFGFMFIVIFIIIIRRFGAWMMRIDEVITLQQEILQELRIIKKGVRGSSNRVEEFLDKKDSSSD
mgnify:CR=1 FL=1